MTVETFTSKEQMERSSRWVLGLVLTLLALGLVMVYSAKTVKSARVDGEPMAPLLEHAVKVAIALVGMLVMMRIDYRHLGRHYGKIYLLTILSLLLLFVPGLGAEINGARRWIKVFGLMTIQPSEYAKLALIVVVSGLIIKSGDRITRLGQGLLVPTGAAGFVCILILCEPDFGTSVIAASLVVTLLVIGGVKIRQFFLLVIVLLPPLFIYALGSLDHVNARIQSFLSRPGTGQVDFSLMAMASGGCFGRGLGASQCKLYFIPECESDFIFAIIGEELGFLGTSLVIFLFAALIFQGVRVLLGIRNRFGFLMATGILTLISTQALVNIAVVAGMTPAKGLPLPFVSSGGSSLFALMMGVGLFLNIARNPDAASERVEDQFCEQWVHRLFKRSAGGIGDVRP